MFADYEKGYNLLLAFFLLVLPLFVLVSTYSLITRSLWQGMRTEQSLKNHLALANASSNEAQSSRFPFLLHLWCPWSLVLLSASPFHTCVQEVHRASVAWLVGVPKLSANLFTANNLVEVYINAHGTPSSRCSTSTGRSVKYGSNQGGNNTNGNNNHHLHDSSGNGNGAGGRGDGGAPWKRDSSWQQLRSHWSQESTRTTASQAAATTTATRRFGYHLRR